MNIFFLCKQGSGATSQQSEKKLGATTQQLENMLRNDGESRCGGWLY